jgi:RNA polymerase sigma factor (TIGR02999 family)
MRQILVNHAHARSAVKRGGQRLRIALDPDALSNGVPDELLLAVDDAVQRLAELDAECARVVELRFFGGLTISDAAEVLGKSPRSVDRCWNFARSWLHRELTRGA